MRIAEGFEALPAMRDRWIELFRSRPHEPSTSFEWTSAMARHHVRPGDRCFLITFHRHDALVGIVPLIARTAKLAGRDVMIVAPLSDEYNTHSDLLVESVDHEIAGALLDALDRLEVRWDCFRMARLLEDSPVAAALGHALTSGGRLHSAREGLPAYVLPLPASFDAYLAGRSGKFRNHLKRVEKKLHGAGTPVVRELQTTAELDRAYEAVLSIERTSWKEEHGTAITAVARQTGFYRDLCASALASGLLHLQWLTVDDRPVAYNLGFIQNRTYHYLKTSYDAAWRPLSPSTYLRARLISDLIARGITSFDFPGEPYEWERQWTDDIRWRQVLTVYAPTARGRLLSLLDHLRHRPSPTRTIQHVDPRASGPRPRPAP